jgi:hypothetical protein
MWKCKHCEESFEYKGFQRANHTRWCLKNPMSVETRAKIEIARKVRIEKPSANQYTKARVEGRKEISKLKGRVTKGHSHSEETKMKLREKALASPHRRLKKNVIMYKGVQLDSSWELELAKRLDLLKIKWERPKPLQYIGVDGKIHHYFPDFYLPDRDLYIDPKNPQAFYVQREKITILAKTFSNIIFLSSLKEIHNFS